VLWSADGCTTGVSLLRFLNVLLIKFALACGLLEYNCSEVGAARKV
jgi:hypothetical protein